MAASLYIVVEGEDPGFDIFVNGRNLARHEDALEKIAAQLCVRPLLEFFSADSYSMALLFEHEAVSLHAFDSLPETLWFDPGEGLATVKALIGQLETNETALGTETAPVLSELREYELVLTKAAHRCLRWHLAASWR